MTYKLENDHLFLKLIKWSTIKPHSETCSELILNFQLNQIILISYELNT